MKILNIFKLLRLNQYIKHIFIIPGFIFGFYVTREIPDFSKIFFAMVSLFSMSSANYVLNEILDKENDKHHILKKERVMVQKKIKITYAFYLYFFCALTGIIFGNFVNYFFLIVIIIFNISGIIYNVRPLRLKDKPIIDVLCESLNNPIRLLLGWSIFFEKITIPSLSLILAYWCVGSFLMNSKRLSEYLYFKSQKKLKILEKYRKVYNYYNENILKTLSFLYFGFTIMFLSIFTIKFKIEYIFLIPQIIFALNTYFYLSLTKYNKMQDVKYFLQHKKLLIAILLIIISFTILTFSNYDFLIKYKNNSIFYKF